MFGIQTQTPGIESGTANETTGNSASSNVEIALDEFERGGITLELIFVSAESAGVEGNIYRDLKRRLYRITTGPDEGFDVSDLPCSPRCLFVPLEDANSITVENWLRVLDHEYRHVIQAEHNPNLAHEFRDSSGSFTTYASFSEACADYGIWVGNYNAQERIDELKGTLGQDRAALLDNACKGNRDSFREVVSEFNAANQSDQAFIQLFPPYR